jgi:uncharacterized protein (TIGR02284 family)
MSDQDINEHLADLIEVTAEAEASFHAAAGEVRSEEARLLLLNRAQRYGQATASLRSTGAARGGGPAATGHRPEPQRIGPADEEHILGECERKESAVAVAFRDALDRRLPPDVHAVVATAFETLLGSLGSLRAARERAVRQRPPAGQPV